ncbi:hypothetical protein DPEC_G00295700 [Dallia pectoralis]|uniref:Uncharacterized protein n=1 Tax=Dallia pectoralis TaxID=75939 RepID=A0ACC2FIT0_DALPE|nr:hypothetical protein DPEC_G00295700 [Dallia pectoralis]
METVETEVKKPHPSSRIPVLQKKNATCNGKIQKAQLKEKACVPPMLMLLGPIQNKRRGYGQSGVWLWTSTSIAWSLSMEPTWQPNRHCHSLEPEPLCQLCRESATQA